MLSVKAMGLKVMPLLTLAVRNGPDVSALPFKTNKRHPRFGQERRLQCVYERVAIGTFLHRRVAFARKQTVLDNIWFIRR